MSDYAKNHRRVHRDRGAAKQHTCTCGASAQEWAHIHNTDPSCPSNYQAMCCSCHQKYDDHWNEATRKKVGRSSVKAWASLTEEQRVERGLRISAAKTGTKYNMTEDGRRKLVGAKLGNKHAVGKRTPEQRERIRIARWGR